ncbi:MAG: hypothetical protein IKB72_06110 [Ruminococcus sp.]|nr:hypothetical protein [Ruminococcus sp.]
MKYWLRRLLYGKFMENASEEFDPHRDDELKKKHPFLYGLTIAGILLLVMVGPVSFVAAVMLTDPALNMDTVVIEHFSFFENIIFISGFISSMGVSVGLCNLFLKVHKQYLGNSLTLKSFGIGILGIGLSCLLIWIL